MHSEVDTPLSTDHFLQGVGDGGTVARDGDRSKTDLEEVSQEVS